MLDRPRADQYSVVTRSQGRPPVWRWDKRAWDQALRHRLLNGVRSQARWRKGTRGVSRWARQGGTECLTQCIAMKGWSWLVCFRGSKRSPNSKSSGVLSSLRAR